MNKNVTDVDELWGLWFCQKILECSWGVLGVFLRNTLWSIKCGSPPGWSTSCLEFRLLPAHSGSCISHWLIISTHSANFEQPLLNPQCFLMRLTKRATKISPHLRLFGFLPPVWQTFDKFGSYLCIEPCDQMLSHCTKNHCELSE